MQKEISAKRLDVVRAKIALVREINSGIRLYLEECKMKGIEPKKGWMETNKNSRQRIIASASTLLGDTVKAR